MKVKRVFLFVLLALAAVFVAVGAACKKSPPPQVGEEAGEYYYDSPAGEYDLTLGDGFVLTLTMGGTTKNGSYSANGGELTFNFEGEEAIAATYESDVIKFTYSSTEMTFLRKIEYTVTFDGNGGNSPASRTVINGRAVGELPTPTRTGYAFLWWCTDSAGNTRFYPTDSVTEDITLYAKWAQSNGAEFSYTFDLNYPNAPAAPAAGTTKAQRAYDLPTPTRTGFTFCGWWVSNLDDGSRLSYECKDGDTVLEENLTLFAKWVVSGKPTLDIEVSGNKISWTNIPNAGRYTVTVNDSLGTTVLLEFTQAPVYNYQFSDEAAGDYTVNVKTENGVDETIYYKNKGLARVSLFSVEGNKLTFNAVANATEYEIRTACANPSHSSTEFISLGNETEYDFSDCVMPAGGLKFTVRAKADGFAESASKEFTFERTLPAVTLSFNEGTQVLSWTSSANATAYKLDIDCGDGTHEHSELVTGTSYSLAECEARSDGKLGVSVIPVNDTWVSPAKAQNDFTKGKLATPRDVTLDGNTYSWRPVAGASGYTVNINGTSVNVEGTSVNIAELISQNGISGSDFTVTVCANGSSPSLSSGEEYCAKSVVKNLTYADGKVSWNPALDAANYEVKLNGNTIYTGASSHTDIQFNTTGANTITVSFAGGEAVSIEVTIYKVTFDVNGGSPVSDYYLAAGDIFRFPTIEKAHEMVEGWYTEAGAQGQKYTEGPFPAGDVTLHANWVARRYQLTLDSGDYSDDTLTGTAVWDEQFSLPAPNVNDETMVFLGWKDNNGNVVTDRFGAGLETWAIDKDITLTAWYEQLFVFTPTANNPDEYSVDKSAAAARLDEITIPVRYNGKLVTEIAPGAFAYLSNLHKISIPETIKNVAIDAFDYSINLRDIDVYAVADKTYDPYYYSANGALAQNRADGVAIVAFPLGKSGSFLIPEGVNYIPSDAFRFANLTEIIIATTVTDIAQNAFADCGSLATVTFIPGGTADLRIASSAFENCVSLEGITLPARLKQVKDGAFLGCENLNAIYVEQGSTNFVSKDGILCSDNGETLVMFPIAKKVANNSYAIPAGIYHIQGKSFRGCELEELIIPKEVQDIQANAFEGSLVKKVTFRDIGESALTEISSYAFANSGMEEITIPDNVVRIGDYAFYNCYDLKTLHFNDPSNSKLEIIGEYAFYNTAIENKDTDTSKDGLLELPHSLREIGGCAFTGNGTQYGFELSGEENQEGVRLKKIVVPASVTKIGDDGDNEEKHTSGQAFAYCKRLEDICLDESSQLRTIGPNTFTHCESLKRFYFPDTYVGLASVLSNCYSITEVTFGENVQIKDGVFGGFGGNYDPDDSSKNTDGKPITTITIPKSVRIISEGAFANCKELETVIFSKGSMTGYEYVDEYHWGTYSGTRNIGRDAYIEAKAFAGCESLESITIPAGVGGCGDSTHDYYAIGEYAFADCINLTDVTFEGTLLSYKSTGGVIGNDIKNGTGVMGRYAFAGCTSLETMTIPANAAIMTSVTSESKSKYNTVGLFDGCTSLRTVDFSSSSISSTYLENQFNGCSSLTEIKLRTGSANIKDGVLLSDNNQTFYALLNPSLITDGVYSIPDTVTKLPDRAFYGNKTIRKLIIPAGVRTIGKEAFAHSDIEEFDFSASKVTTIGDNAFESTKATSIILPSTIIKLGDRCFQYSDIESITIPANVTTVTTIPEDNNKVDGKNYITNFGKNMFLMCRKLRQVTFAGASTNKITSINESAFNGCISLTDITLPASVTSIESSAFAGCTQLTSLNAPANLASIGDSAFSGCTNLATLDLENTKLQSIGSSAFAGCTSLDSLTIPATITTLGTGAFGTIQNVTINGFAADADLSLQGGVLYNKDKTKILGYAGSVGDLCVPSSVTSYQTLRSAGPFDGCESLGKVTFQGAITEIPAYAFSGSSVTEVVIPASVTAIGESAFSGCASLRTVTFENIEALTTIGSNAFNGTGITSFRIGKNVTAIGSAAFANCMSLETVTFDDGSVATLNLGNAFVGSGLREITIPDRVNALSDGTFEDCKSLIKVILPESINSIGSYAFAGCTALTSLYIPARAVLGAFVFSDWTADQHVYIMRLRRASSSWNKSWNKPLMRSWDEVHEANPTIHWGCNEYNP